MKTISKYNLILFIISLSLVSCEKTLEFNEEDVTPLLVVNCRLIPGEHVQIELTQTVHVLEESNYFSPVKNALITIRNDETESSRFEYVSRYDSIMEYDWKREKYYIKKWEVGVYINREFPVEAGKTYSISVEAGGFETVQAQTTLPSEPAIISIDTLSERASDQYSAWLNRKAKITFSDPALLQNYYELAVYRAQISLAVDPYAEENTAYFSVNQQFINSEDPVFGSDESSILGEIISSYSYLSLFDDGLINGKTYTLSFTYDQDYIPSYDNKNREAPPMDYRSYVFNVYKIMFNAMDEALYRYTLTSTAQNYRQSDIFSEPVLVYTNIESGAGFLGGFVPEATYIVSHNFTDELLHMLPEGDAKSLFDFIQEQTRNMQYPNKYDNF